MIWSSSFSVFSLSEATQCKFIPWRLSLHLLRLWFCTWHSFPYQFGHRPLFFPAMSLLSLWLHLNMRLIVYLKWLFILRAPTAGHTHMPACVTPLSSEWGISPGTGPSPISISSPSYLFNTPDFIFNIYPLLVLLHWDPLCQILTSLLCMEFLYFLFFSCWDFIHSGSFLLCSDHTTVSGLFCNAIPFLHLSLLSQQVFLRISRF